MVWLGLDAGGSATRWALVDGAGYCLARGAGPAISGHVFDDAAALRVAAEVDQIAATVRAACATAPAGILAGITGLGAGTPAAEAIRAVLAARFAVAPEAVDIRDDLWIAARAVFRPGQGHVVYAGTGAIGMHIQADGGLVRVGGRGPLVDDAGSAFAIGRAALDLLWRQRDAAPGFGSPLADAVDGVIGGPEWDRYRAYIYGGGRNAVAQLARAIAGAADAAPLFHAAGAELARLAVVLVRRVGVLPVAVLGRVPDLHPAYMAGFREAAGGLAHARRRPDAALAAAHLAAGADAVQAADTTQEEAE